MATATLDRVRTWIDEARRIVVLTGAGISTDSGIPDFRGPQGVWTKNPAAEKTATLSHYLSDPAVRRQAWANRLASPAWAAQPNAGHLALVELQRRGTLDTLVTQNIDELHQRAGIDHARVVELHGTIWRYSCLSCGAGGPMEDALARVRAGEDDPACVDCGGILKSATISFGQDLVAGDLERAASAAARSDLLLAVGTTLTVYPAAGLVPVALRRGVPVIIVNGEHTAFDDVADAVIRGSISRELQALLLSPESRPDR